MVATCADVLLGKAYNIFPLQASSTLQLLPLGYGKGVVANVQVADVTVAGMSVNRYKPVATFPKPVVTCNLPVELNSISAIRTFEPDGVMSIQVVPPSADLSRPEASNVLGPVARYILPPASQTMRLQVNPVVFGNCAQVTPLSVLLKTPLPLTASALKYPSPVQKYMVAGVPGTWQISPIERLLR